MLAASTGATLSGLFLRWRGLTASPAVLRLLVPADAVSQIVFILLATHYDATLLLSRPRQRPQLPEYMLACIAGANAALTAFVAARILRRMVLGRTPPQIHANKGGDQSRWPSTP